ncbi:MAG: M23 family metallopeptidase [Chitinophagales bacterium]|nr:M23 family metallopeptidase [Chitinophagales bacterium]
MQKETYYYNPNTLKYEKVKRTLGQRIWLVLGFIFTSLFFAFIILTLGYTFITPPAQANIEESLKELDNNYIFVNKRLEQISRVVSEMEDRDDNIYRVIFDAPPLPKDIRRNEKEGEKLSKSSEKALIQSTTEKLKELERKLYVQSISYSQLEDMYKNKSKYLEAVPAIQPVSNKDLKRIASGFGTRIDPIYKTVKVHSGIDFSAPTGTKVYATGNGIVEYAGNQSDGYGNKIIISHGFGFQTLYGHNSKLLVRKGQKVVRGQKIALVGSTGKSTGSHIHYEVIKNEVKIDPVNFFFNDLNPQQYDEVLKLAQEANQSLD